MSGPMTEVERQEFLASRKRCSVCRECRRHNYRRTLRWTVFADVAGCSSNSTINNVVWSGHMRWTRSIEIIAARMTFSRRQN